MAKLEFKLNRAGVSKLLKSQKAAEVCEAHANRVRERCGDGYVVTKQVGGKTRSNASVMAVTVEARRENLENNILEKALH